MKVYHGSSIGNLEVLNPNVADHKIPYVYFTTNEVVATLYTVNPLKPPYYWFPYGFNKDGLVNYTEVYPDAMKEVYANKVGYIYECNVDEEKLINPTHIVCARLSSEPVKVSRCIKIPDVYESLQQFEKNSKLFVNYYCNMKKDQLEIWYEMIVDDIKNQNLLSKPDCSYSQFLKDKLPQVWGRCLKETKL